MKHLGIIFLLLVPFLLVGQAWKAKPFSISVFNNATLLPPGSITATFNQPLSEIRCNLNRKCLI